MNPDQLPLPAPRLAPDPLADEAVVPLLGGRLASQWRAAAALPAGHDRIRDRLLARIRRSAAAARSVHTMRARGGATVHPADGVCERVLYETDAARASMRPGEPLRTRLIELAPGARWSLPAESSAWQRDWLVLSGSARVDAVQLHLHDYHVLPAGSAASSLRSAEGAWLYLRGSEALADAPAVPSTVRAAQSTWRLLAPGISRRLLWRHGEHGAFLIHALPGAALPPHGHHHDEECLMLEGELFLDEILLRGGDYQLAPAGFVHHTSCTDTGVLVYAHGDVDLAVIG